MSKLFISANPDYDEVQVRKSGQLAQSQANEVPGFVFVNYDVHENDEEQKRISRKLIRSKATAYSHRIAPRGALKHEVPLRLARSAEESPVPWGRSVACGGDNGSIITVTAATTSRSSGRQKAAKHALGTEAGVCMAQTHQANISRKRSDVRPKRDRDGSCGREGSLSPGALETALPDPLSMDASLKDPFLTYPVRYRRWYGQLIHYWYQVVLPRSTRVIKASPRELQTYTYWSRWQELSEPVLFYTSLFLASGIPVAEGLFPLSAALWLRQKTVQAMQDALNDPQRATSIPVILAVGRIALHEHIYGNRTLAHTMHRPAQLRMINMRGGLANLGLPSMTVQLIVWTDALMSAETGETPYFADVPSQIAIKSYTAEEAIHVTNFSSPHRTAHPGYDHL